MGDAVALVDAIRRAGVRDERVLDAFQAVPRRCFVPVEAVDRADADEPISIGHGQVTTQPSLVARMVEALELSPDDRVLEIGTGLGYQAAILGVLAREIYSLERLADLATRARGNLRTAGLDNVGVVVADGVSGLPAHAPYDAIVVAAAAPAVPPALAEQLREGGRLVQPMGPGGDEIVTKFHKYGGRLVREADVVAARFVPLIPGPAAAQPEPDFNILVSTIPLAPGRARREVVARLRGLTGVAPEAVPTLGLGILAVRVAMDARELMRRLRTLCERNPRAFRYTLKWLPVDAWARPDVPAMRDAVARLRHKIGPGETWRLTFERRTASTALDPREVIPSLAEVIDARVDLRNPDKIVLVQLFDDWVAVSIVAPGETFSVVKTLGTRPVPAPTPDEAPTP